MGSAGRSKVEQLGQWSAAVRRVLKICDEVFAFIHCLPSTLSRKHQEVNKDQTSHAFLTRCAWIGPGRPSLSEALCLGPRPVEFYPIFSSAWSTRLAGVANSIWKRTDLHMLYLGELVRFCSVPFRVSTPFSYKVGDSFMIMSGNIII